MMALRVLLAMGLMQVAACGGIDLDPLSHRELPRATPAETKPPPELLNGDAR